MTSLVGKQSHASNLNVSAADGTFRVWGLNTLFIEIVERRKMNFKMEKKYMSLNILRGPRSNLEVKTDKFPFFLLLLASFRWHRGHNDGVGGMATVSRPSAKRFQGFKVGRETLAGQCTYTWPRGEKNRVPARGFKLSGAFV